MGKIHEWFGLSYAPWLTLPRILLEAMPDEWQEQMAELLREYEDTFPGSPNGIEGTRVQCTRGGQLVKTPPDLINYRRPNTVFVATMRERPK